MKLGHRIIKHITLIALTSIVAISASHAEGDWYYRAFELKKRLAPLTQEVQNVESWVNSHQPKHDGLVMVPAVNTIHVWARHDQSHHWRFRFIPLKQKKFRPEFITSELNAGRIVPGGFLSGKNHRNRFVYFSTRRARATGKWYYTHVGTKSKSWKTYIADFLRAHGPNHSEGIRAALSNGRDFHLWVRHDGMKGYTHYLDYTKGSMSNKHKFLNRKFKRGIRKDQYMPIGFNRQNQLWYVGKRLGYIKYK